LDQIAIWLHSNSWWIGIFKLADRATNRPSLNMRHLRSSQRRSRRFPFPEVWRRVHWYIRAYTSQGPVASIFTVVNEVCKWYITAHVPDQLGACNRDPRRQLPRCHFPKQENRPVSSSLGDHVKNNEYRDHVRQIYMLAVYFRPSKKNWGDHSLLTFQMHTQTTQTCLTNQQFQKNNCIYTAKHLAH
jgi:hypothetical protein